MSAPEIFLTLHVIVFAYWLGGDLGVFYPAFLLIDEKRPLAGRLTAGKILFDIDVIPRICLLLALPTGLAVAATKGWLDLSNLLLALTFLASFLWIALVLWLHHHASVVLKQIDVLLRYVFLAGLWGGAFAGLAGAFPLPFFIALKMIILGFAVAMGILVRVFLSPFGPAYMRLASGDDAPDVNHTIRQCLTKSRYAVLAIWAALVCAAFLGISTPS